MTLSNENNLNSVNNRKYPENNLNSITSKKPSTDYDLFSVADSSLLYFLIVGNIFFNKNVAFDVVLVDLLF